MEYRDKLPYVGNELQLFPYKEYRFCGGKAEGVKGVDISNGSTLDITIIPDRAMDIFQIRYKGKNLNYITPNGINSSNYYSSYEDEFLHTFFGGFLTTCGLSSIGKHSKEKDRSWGLHGRISNTPAENFSIKQFETHEGPEIKLKGTMTEAVLFNEKLRLDRTISLGYKKNYLTIHDTVENFGSTDAGHMILYHFNMGYPFLSEDTEVCIPTAKTVARDEEAEKGLDFYYKVLSPQKDFKERCYYHALFSDKNRRSCYGCYNHKLNIGIIVEYNSDNLDYFVQWNMFGMNDYAMGLETANCIVDSRERAAQENILKYLKPGEIREYTHKIYFTDDYMKFKGYLERGTVL